MRRLLLGGVGDALRLARQLGPEDIYSLAGLASQPQGLQCQLRVGGFGGAPGLAAFLRAQAIDLLLDVTHPYAARISQNALLAARQVGIPCWALRRPTWQRTPDDDWREVADWAALQQQLAPFSRPFFTIGREPLAHLQEIPGHQQWTLRLLDDHPVPARARIIADRGPFDLASERALFQREGFDVLISKNSGGSATQAKLQVARERGLPVFMPTRPTLPTADREFTDPQRLQEALQRAADQDGWTAK